MTFFLILICVGLGFTLYRTRRQLQTARGKAGVRGSGFGDAESWSQVAEDLSGLRFRQRISDLEKQLQQAQSALGVAQRQITALKQDNEDLNGRLRQKDSRIQEIADEKGSLLNENQRLRTRLQELGQQSPSTVQDRQGVEITAHLQAQIEDYRVQQEQYRQTISQLEVAKEELKAELQTMQAERSNAQLSHEEEMNALERQLVNAKQEADDLNRCIAEVTQRLATQEQDYLAQISVLEEQISQTEARLRDADNSRSLEDRTEILVEKDRRIQELEVSIERLKGQISELQRHQSVEVAELETSLSLLRDHLALINNGDQAGVEEGDLKGNNHAALRELAGHLLDVHAQQEFFFRRRIQELESEKQFLISKNEELEKATQGPYPQSVYRAAPDNWVQLRSTLPEIYPGEKEAILVAVLKIARSQMPDRMGNAINYWRRRKDIIDEITSLNSDEVLLKMHQEIERVFSGYRNFDGTVRRLLKDLGFEAKQDGHIHVYPLNDNNYKFSFGGTVSDRRAHENIARDFKHYFF